jgi:1-acyl-sn-glycerol-3-phosphate acyltransferase
MGKLLRVIYVIYALIVFIVLMLPVFIWSLFVSLFGRIRGGNLTYYACVVWSDMWFFMIGIRHKNIYETPHDADESFIYVSNHISYLDIPAIVQTFRKPLRPLGKAESAKIPVFGFIYKNSIVTVDRSNPANRAKSVLLLKSILKRGISVLVFPEGTFNETGQPLKKFYDGAFRVAIETGTPVKPVLMLDTYDRMNYRSIFCLQPGKNRSVFLEAIPTAGLSAEDISLLRDKVHAIMEEKLRAYKASWIKD